MPQPRYRLVDTKTTPYYHCISRCVRRAYLCGYDRATRKNFDHRKQWILDRIRKLSSVFAIDVCAYAIMSNHFHLVLHVDSGQTKLWSSDEVIRRWLSLYSGPLVAQRFKAGFKLDQAENNSLDELVNVWRSRLSDLSWYMRCLNEAIARMANKEDNCTGRFWEGRFRSQALLNEGALISCMAYVDLNPIRAKTSKTLEQSEFTSIQERLREYSRKKNRKNHSWLAPMASNDKNANTLPISAQDYFTLVDWTGRAVRSSKRGSIPSNVKPILCKLGLKEENWVNNTQHFGKRFGRVLGRLNEVQQFARRIEQKWFIGKSRLEAHYQ